jgi:hypothetical protein
MTPPLIRSIIQFALPSILAVCVTWGMQLARIESLERQLHDIHNELGSHEQKERVDGIVRRLEQLMESLIQTLNRIENRIPRR